VYLAMANMWNLLCGYSGLISLCQPVPPHAHVGVLLREVRGLYMRRSDV
jgi:hypothetical protein